MNLAPRLILVSLVFLAGRGVASDYFPPPHEWKHRTPAEASFDAARLAEAIEYAKAHGDVEPRDMRRVLLDSYSEKEPDYRILGPVRDRVDTAGIVVRGGTIIAEWGDVERADMTFSAAKSYLSTLAGLAVADGRIASIDDRAARYIDGDLFADAHDAPITWRELLQQNSDWKGTLWGVPDWADRPEGKRAHWAERELHEPGTHFKYNDVRINALALALLQVFREPLPRVLAARVMEPIGASSTWRWLGYDNSWVELDGLRMQSVSGGGHFGGGLFISALDHARYGLLFLRHGRWNTRQLVPASWIALAHQPSPTKDDYGLLWWLNTGRKAVPAAPESAYWAAGFGGHYVYIDDAHDLVVVLRWQKDFPGTMAKILGALR